MSNEESRSLKGDPLITSSDPTLRESDPLESSSSYPQKRPRLDSGSQSIRSISADVLANSQNSLDDAAVMDSDSENAQKVPNSSNTITLDVRTNTTNGHRNGSGDSGSEERRSSSDVPIEVADLEDVEPEADPVESIVVEGEDDFVARLIEGFPFGDFSRPQKAAQNLARRIEADSKVDGHTVIKLAEWLAEINHSCSGPGSRRYWKELFYDQSVMWDHVAVCISNMMNREVITDDEEEQFQTGAILLFEEYFKLVHRIILLDYDNLIRSQTGMLDRPMLSNPQHLKTIRAILWQNLFIRRSLIEHRSLPLSLPTQLATSFMINSESGFKGLCKLIHLLTDRFEDGPAIIDHAFCCLSLISTLIAVAYGDDIQDYRISPFKKDHVNLMINVFNDLDVRLKQNLLQDKDYMPVDYRKHFPTHVAELLKQAMMLDEIICQEKFQEIVESDTPMDQRSYPFVSATVWKIKLMKDYICKGKMEVRCIGTETMASDLVAVFREYQPQIDTNSGLRKGTVPPECEIVAQVLLDQEIMEYLMSSDSHPQIITRSGNIVGFLVLTNNFTQDRADLVWNTLVANQDRRVAHAVIQSLINVLKSLTSMREELYICQKLVTSPLPVLDQNADVLIDCLFSRLHQRLLSIALNDEQLQTMATTSIALMSQSSSSRQFASVAQHIADESARLLRAVATNLSPQLRHRIYRECVAKLQNTKQSDYSIVRALTIILDFYEDDLNFVAEDLELTRIIMESVASISRACHSDSLQLRCSAEYAPIIESLKYRSILAQRLLEQCPESAPSQSQVDFWKNLVGEEAINPHIQDYTWTHLTKVVMDPHQSNRIVLKSLHDHFLPIIEPLNITLACVGLLEKYSRILLNESQPTELGARGVLQLPGIDLMWQIMLMAPNGQCAEHATHHLARLWIEPHLEKLTNDSLETNHQVIVRLCLERMATAFEAVNNASNGISTNATIMNEEQAFSRCLRFLIALMQIVRSRPDMQQADSPITSPLLSKPTEINGTPISIRYQIFSRDNAQEPQKEAMVGDLETFSEFHQRICSWTGFSDFKTYWGGIPVNLLENPMTTLGDFKAGSKNLLLIKQNLTTEAVANNNALQRTSAKQKTVFDREVMQNFENFYKFLDTDSRMSSDVFDFLKSYAPHEIICQKIEEMSDDFALLFPPSSMNKTHYSLRALEHVIEMKTRREDEVDQNFFPLAGIALEWLLVEQELPAAGPELAKYLKISQHVIPILINLFKILAKVDLSPLRNGDAAVDRFVKVLQLYVNSPGNMSLVSQTFELLLQSVFTCPDAWPKFKSLDLVDLHEQILLSSPDSRLRTAVAATASTLIARFKSRMFLNYQEFINHYWEILSALLPKISLWYNQSREYFSLTESVFNRRFPQSELNLSGEDISLLEEYWKQWGEFLLNCEVDQFVGREIYVPTIAGFSTLCRLAFQILKQANVPPITADMAENLWYRFLFPVTELDDGEETADIFPILDSKTRQVVYDLLSAITIEHEDSALQEVCEWISKISKLPKGSHLEAPRTTVERSRLIRGETGFLGLRNLGNTCYMNSLLTQLYMNPKFRSFMVNQGLFDRSQQRLLAATQGLFSRMQNGYGPYGDPALLAQNIWTYDEPSINVAEQMDVQEFFNLLFDQWESQFPAEIVKETFRSFYGGKLVNQIKSKECEHISEKVDPFLNLQCDVQGKSDLLESLRSFVEGDVMQGDNKYKCDQCGGKFVDAVRRTRLKDIPDNLILHLKRFEYDVGLQRRSKINDYFEFPKTIDMSKYSIYSDSENSVADMFELVGVLVHKGQAEHGHYVSYIRARPSQFEAQPVWLLFDDSEVSYFDVNQLGEQCFGGPVHKSNVYGSSFKVNNAYMLFYERSSTLKRSNKSLKEVQTESKASIPMEMEQAITAENEQSLRNYCLFGEPHMQFVSQAISKLSSTDLNGGAENGKHDCQDAIINACLRHVWKVSTRAKDLPDLAEKLQYLTAQSEECGFCGYLIARWLSQNFTETRDILLRGNQPRVRHMTQTFIVTILQNIRRFPEPYGLDVANTSDLSPGTIDTGNGALYLVLQCLHVIVEHEMYWNSRAFDEFFTMLFKISMLGEGEALCMIYHGFFTSCLEFLTMLHVPKLQEKHLRVIDLMEKRRVQFHNLGRLLDSLLRFVDTQTAVEPWEDRSIKVTESAPMLSTTTTEQQLLRLQLTEHDYKYMHVYADGGVVWLAKLFQKWDLSADSKQVVPERIVATILSRDDTRNLYDTMAVGKLFAIALSQFTALEMELYIRAASAFLSTAKHMGTIRSVVNAMGEVVAESNEGENGPLIMDFFDKLRKCQSQGLEMQPEGPYDGSFYRLALSKTKVFAPQLLTWIDDDMVRYQAAATFEDMVLLPSIAGDEPTELEELRIRYMRETFKACLEKVRDLLEHGYSKRFLSGIVHFMKNISDLLQNLYEVDSATGLRDDEEDLKMMDSLQVIEAAYEAAPVQEESMPAGGMTEGSDVSDEDDDELEA